jgi:hypothetical protein
MSSQYPSGALSRLDFFLMEPVSRNGSGDWLQIGGPGLNSSQAQGSSFPPLYPYRLWDLLSVLCGGYGGILSRGWGLRRPDREADHSPQFTARSLTQRSEMLGMFPLRPLHTS